MEGFRGDGVGRRRVDDSERSRDGRRVEHSSGERVGLLAEKDLDGP